MRSSTRFRVLMRDGFTCRYCGRRAPDVVLEVDHIEPRSAGGSDDESNLVTACFDCNRGKFTRSTALALVVEDAPAAPAVPPLIPEADCCPKCTWCNAAESWERHKSGEGYFAWYHCELCHSSDWRTYWSGDGCASWDEVQQSRKELNESWQPRRAAR